MKKQKYRPEKRRGIGMLQGEHAEPFALRSFIHSLKVEILGDVPGEDLNGIFISFPGVSFQGHGFH